MNIYNLTPFIHLCPSPSCHNLSPVFCNTHVICLVPLLSICSSAAYSKPADSMILGKGRLDYCHSISLWILHLWQFHFVISSTLATQTSLIFVEHSRATPVLQNWDGSSLFLIHTYLHQRFVTCHLRKRSLLRPPVSNANTLLPSQPPLYHSTYHVLSIYLLIY